MLNFTKCADQTESLQTCCCLFPQCPLSVLRLKVRLRPFGTEEITESKQKKTRYSDVGFVPNVHCSEGKPPTSATRNLNPALNIYQLALMQKNRPVTFYRETNATGLTRTSPEGNQINRLTLRHMMAQIFVNMNRSVALCASIARHPT